MKLAIVGSRNYEDYSEFKKTIKEYFELNKITEIVSGGARGIDKMAEKFADENNIPKKIFEANWNQYGKRAGPARNRKIWEYADEGIAFLSVGSKGTKNSIEMANFFGKKVKVVNI